MSKYNHFAQDLQAAFIKARDEYIAAVDELEAAKKAKEEAGRWRTERYAGENAARKARADAEWLAAQQEFKAFNSRAWEELDAKRAELRAALKAEVDADTVFRPEDVDANAVKLMESGAMTTTDFYSFQKQFADNGTMTRLIAKYAKDYMDEMTDTGASTLATRGALQRLVDECANGGDQVMQSWDGLSKVVEYCTGRYRSDRRSEEPTYIISSGKWWDQLVGDAVENF